MTFPETRATLIERLVSLNREEDWQQFLADYWNPLCLFAERWGARDRADAEDVASETFEVLWRNRLLVRWIAHRSAKLRTLLCTVVRNLLSSHNRVRDRRDELAGELLRHAEEVHDEQQQAIVDAFYAAWADDVMQRALQVVTVEYCAAGRADHLRVLRARGCEGLPFAEIARLLHRTEAQVDSCFRTVCDRLRKTLADLVRRHVSHYSRPDELEAEFEQEWLLLGQYHTAHGGFEAAMAKAWRSIESRQAAAFSNQGVAKALDRLTTTMRRPDPQSEK